MQLLLGKNPRCRGNTGASPTVQWALPPLHHYTHPHKAPTQQWHAKSVYLGPRKQGTSQGKIPTPCREKLTNCPQLLLHCSEPLEKGLFAGEKCCAGATSGLRRP